MGRASQAMHGMVRACVARAHRPMPLCSAHAANSGGSTAFGKRRRARCEVCLYRDERTARTVSRLAAAQTPPVGARIFRPVARLENTSIILAFPFAILTALRPQGLRM